MSDLRRELTRAIDDNFPAYARCVGPDASCPHHDSWREELEVLVDAVLTQLKVDEVAPVISTVTWRTVREVWVGAAWSTLVYVPEITDLGAAREELSRYRNVRPVDPHPGQFGHGWIEESHQSGWVRLGANRG